MQHVILKHCFADLHNTLLEGFNKVPILLVHTIDVLIRIFQNNKKHFAWGGRERHSCRAEHKPTVNENLVCKNCMLEIVVRSQIVKRGEIDESVIMTGQRKEFYLSG